MKKVLIAILLLTTAHYYSQAQKLKIPESGSAYATALGIKVDFGSDYKALMGVSAKHFFAAHHAGEAQVNFGKGITMIGVQYQYHGDIQNAEGLKWYLGLGPAVAFTKSTYSYYSYYWDDYYGSTSRQTDFLLRPAAGLDYKIREVPLNFSFDWSPIFTVTHGTDFTAARFSMAARYAF